MIERTFGIIIKINQIKMVRALPVGRCGMQAYLATFCLALVIGVCRQPFATFIDSPIFIC